MGMIPDRTIRQAIAGVHGCAVHRQIERDTCEALGLDGDMTVAELQRRLSLWETPQ